MSFHRKVDAVVVALFVALILYGPTVRLFTLPDSVAINASCEPEGWQNEFRLAIHGREFWAGQVQAVDREAREAADFPRVTADLQQRVAKVVEDANRKMEAIYSKYPILRPSEAKKLARSPRALADQIEREESVRIASRLKEKRVGALLACRPQLVERATR